jgi:hypothetical protein
MKKEPPEFFPSFIPELHLLLLASQVIRHKSFLFKSLYVTTPLGGTRYATTGVTSSTCAKHESDVQLCGQSSFKRYVHVQLLLPSLITRSFPLLEEASGHRSAFRWWCKSLNHMYLLHIVDYEVLVNLVSTFVIFSLQISYSSNTIRSSASSLLPHWKRLDRSCTLGCITMQTFLNLKKN